MRRPYTGRFAPSPTGPLHAGSLVAALASWLDARAHGGRWLLRIEDTDTPRTVPGAEAHIAAQLAAHGLVPDAPPTRQSDRTALYAAATDRLRSQAAVYDCDCSRRTLRQRNGGSHTGTGFVGDAHERPACAHLALRAPSACRSGHSHGCALRVRASLPDGRDSVVAWTDRRLGAAQQNVSQHVGDFVVRRGDGCWSYQLAAVVDDGAQGVTDVVRGDDLADNTPRQIHLQRLLGLPTPRYLHTPLVLADDGRKLSKQNGAVALSTAHPVAALQNAGAVLGLHVDPTLQTTPLWLAAAVGAWSARWRIGQEA